MKKLFLFLALITNTFLLNAKKDVDTSLSVNAIPEALKENAHAIIRDANTEVKIIAIDKVKYKRTRTITILDSKGKEYANMLCRYTLLQSVDNISGTLYDGKGLMVEKMKMQNAEDISTYGYSSIFHSDSRVKAFNFDYYKYPFTVSYTIEQTIKTTFFLPEWEVRPSPDCAVENASFTLDYPDDIAIRYKDYQMPGSASPKDISEKKNRHTLLWEIKNIQAKTEQPFSKSENYDGPTVILSADKFDLLGHKGNMNSWKDLGMFIYNLNEGLDILPEDKKATVKELTANKTDKYDKVQALYKYMQESTRYVAIEYGLAGWQTFDVMDVAKNGYGDCKGLTNYLKALLKEAGINSYATLVFAGSDDYFKLDESFTFNAFNHVILCVPDTKDTIWVECTSQEMPAGYLGSFTQDRKVLVVTENGGVICNTPAYNESRNYINRNAVINFVPGVATQKIDIRNRYVGLMQDELSHLTKNVSDTKLKELVNSKFPFTSYSVDKYKYTPKGDQSLPELEENVTVAVSGFSTQTPKRTFLNIGWMANPMANITQSKARTLPLVFNESFKIIDTVIINLPEETAIESMPEGIDMSYNFGVYKTSFQKNKNQITFTRTFIQHKGVFNATEYQNYLAMYNAINAGKNNLNIVLLNK